MKKNRKTYHLYQLVSTAFMIIALFWLTISTPFVYAHQQKMADREKMANTGTTKANTDQDAANPFGNNTEEKSSNSSNTLSEEYLHDHHINEHFITVVSQFPTCEDAGTYIAYHGELLVPPPNAA
jgi:hypothetical protein